MSFRPTASPACGLLTRPEGGVPLQRRADVGWPRRRVQSRQHDHAVVIPIEGNSYRRREHANLLPEHLRNRAALQASSLTEPKRGPGRPRKEAAANVTG